MISHASSWSPHISMWTQLSSWACKTRTFSLNVVNVHCLFGGVLSSNTKALEFVSWWISIRTQFSYLPDPLETERAMHKGFSKYKTVIKHSKCVIIHVNCCGYLFFLNYPQIILALRWVCKHSIHPVGGSMIDIAWHSHERQCEVCGEHTSRFKHVNLIDVYISLFSITSNWLISYLTQTEYNNCSIVPLNISKWEEHTICYFAAFALSIVSNLTFFSLF